MVEVAIKSPRRIQAMNTPEPRFAIQSYNAKTEKWEIAYQGQVLHKFIEKSWSTKVWRESKARQKLDLSTDLVLYEKDVVIDNIKEAEKAKESRFTIDERFAFVEELVGMVRDDVTPSMMVTGQGGLGKSYTVLRQVKDLQEDKDFIVIKGFSTAKALYRTLQIHNGKLIIFDDCDSVLKDPSSQNLLKTALDSFGKRRISWNAESNDDLMRAFDFTGKIIFISNLTFDKIPQALVSRSYTIDLSMTTKDILARMKTILPDLVPGEVTMKEKQDAMEFVEKHANEISDLNFRTLIKVAKIRKGAKGDWKKMAEYMTIGQG